MSVIRVNKTEPYDIFIGRPSPYGNPFIIGENGTRKEVLAKFKEYFKHLSTSNLLLDDLNNKKIACWCSMDQSCHGDILIELFNERQKLLLIHDVLE